MAESNIWEAIARSSSRELFDFVLTFEAHFELRRANASGNQAAEVSEGDIAHFLFEMANDKVTAHKPNLAEVKS